MTAPSPAPTERTTHPPARGLRRLPPCLSETHPLRRLWEIAEFPPLIVGVIVLWIWQERGTPTFGENAIALLIIMLYVAFALHLRREGRERIALLDQQEATLREQREAPPLAPRGRRKPGRKRGVPTGFDRETAREQARRLRQLRREGTTWPEAARAVGLTEDQAKNVYKRFDDLMAEDDGR